MIREIFEVFDVAKEGWITAKELGTILDAFGIKGLICSDSWAHRITISERFLNDLKIWNKTKFFVWKKHQIRKVFQLDRVSSMDSSFTEIYDVLAAGLSEPSRQAYGLWNIALFHWFEIVLKSLFDVLNYLHKFNLSGLRCFSLTPSRFFCSQLLYLLLSIVNHVVQTWHIWS